MSFLHAPVLDTITAILCTKPHSCGQFDAMNMLYTGIQETSTSFYAPFLPEKFAGPVLNLSFLMDHVMEKVKPLFWDAVLDSPIPLKVLAFPSRNVWFLAAAAIILHAWHATIPYVWHAFIPYVWHATIL